MLHKQQVQPTDVQEYWLMEFLCEDEYTGEPDKPGPIKKSKKIKKVHPLLRLFPGRDDIGERRGLAHSYSFGGGVRGSYFVTMSERKSS